MYLYYDTTQELILTCLLAISAPLPFIRLKYYFSDTPLFSRDYKSRARGGETFPPENSLSLIVIKTH